MLKKQGLSNIWGRKEALEEGRLIDRREVGTGRLDSEARKHEGCRLEGLGSWDYREESLGGRKVGRTEKLGTGRLSAQGLGGREAPDWEGKGWGH